MLDGFQLSDMSRIWESTYVTFKIENSILIGIYRKDLTIDLQVAKQIVQDRLSFVNNEVYPALADARYVKLATKEARDYFATKDGTLWMPALAILVGNHLTVIMANLFMRFSKPLIPTKAFRTREQALKWLQQFIPKEQMAARTIDF